MQSNRFVILVVLVTLACGCGTTYIYQGDCRGPDADGQTRDHTIYWNKTERALWFDVSSKTMWLCSRGALLVVTFRDTDEGIIFEGGPKDVAPDGTSMTGQICGRVVGVHKIDQLTEGNVLIEMHCKYHPDDFDAPGNTYLAPGNEAYRFVVIKSQGSILEDEPRCR